MELRHLRYFVAVAEELHFGRAARRLNVAQPPLSQQIRALEAELGLRLFHRTSRKVELTAEGRVFCEHARSVLTQARRAVEDAQAASRGESGRIAIGFVTSAIYTLVPAILKEFHRRHPGVEMRCLGSPPLRLIQAVRQRELDVAFVRFPLREDGLVAAALFDEPIVAAMPADHRLAARTRIRLSELDGEAFVIMSRETAPSFHEVVVNECHRGGFTPRMAHEAADLQTVLALVAAGLGVSLVPQSLRHWRHPGVAYREIGPRPSRLPLTMVWRDEPSQPLVEAFTAAARSVAATSVAVRRRRRALAEP